MEPYKIFANSTYPKLFNHFLKKFITPKINKEISEQLKVNNPDVELKIYGFLIRPKNSIYENIPVEELLVEQCKVDFFIDSNKFLPIIRKFEPSIESYILENGKSFLHLQEFNNRFPSGYLKIQINKRSLVPITYIYKDSTNENTLPFIEKEKNGIKTRVFNEQIENEELKWHFDEKDRKVKILKSNGWKFQIDNKIPIELIEGQIISIPKGVYHRVIKGHGDLIVKIREY